jgi:hypothetical protein
MRSCARRGARSLLSTGGLAKAEHRCEALTANVYYLRCRDSLVHALCQQDAVLKPWMVRPLTWFANAQRRQGTGSARPKRVHACAIPSQSYPCSSTLRRSQRASGHPAMPGTSQPSGENLQYSDTRMGGSGAPHATACVWEPVPASNAQQRAHEQARTSASCWWAVPGRHAWARGEKSGRLGRQATPIHPDQCAGLQCALDQAPARLASLARIRAPTLGVTARTLSRGRRLRNAKVPHRSGSHGALSKRET